MDNWQKIGPPRQYISFTGRILTCIQLADNWNIYAIHIISCYDYELYTAGRHLEHLGNTYHLVLGF